MDNSLPPSPLFKLPRELRDKIYDELFTSIAAIPDSKYVHIRFGCAYRDRFPDLLRWRFPPNTTRSSCYGLLYSCRQAYSEIVESIERHGGVSFELELRLVGISPVDPAERDPSTFVHWSSELWPTWIVLPLYNYPNPSESESESESKTSHRGKCQNLHVSLKVQSESGFRWTMGMGLAYLPNNLFSLLARFLLHGPSGIGLRARSPIDSTSTMWDIDTLSVHVTGTGTTFTEPYNDELRIVPADAVIHAEMGLAENMERLCTSGALSGRVRVVKLIGDSGNEREWLVEQGKCLSEENKRDWMMYGWIIEPGVEDTWHEEIANIPTELSRQRQRLFGKLACCCLQ